MSVRKDSRDYTTGTLADGTPITAEFDQFDHNATLPHIVCAAAADYDIVTDSTLRLCLSVAGLELEEVTPAQVTALRALLAGDAIDRMWDAAKRHCSQYEGGALTA